MLSRNLFGGALTAAVGVVVLTLTASPVPAFTLSAPSLNEPVFNTGVEKVWWYRWGYGYRPWGWGWRPRYGFYGAGPVRRCWRGPLGYLRCGWW
jgi:hypothetical protein